MQKIDDIIHRIEGLAIDPKVKDELVCSILEIKKESDRKEFNYKRSQKEVESTIGFLNKTIQDLKGKHQDIISFNEKLLIQNEEVRNQKAQLDDESIKLSKKIKDLENSYAELEQFSYIASHDLKSPLRTIGTFSQLLQKSLKGKLEESTEEFLTFIVKGIQQMNAVIDDLLSYSRVGVKETDFKVLDFSEILDLVIFNLTNDIENNNAKVIIDQMPAEVFANRSNVIQIFQNLIGNAIKFKGEGKPVIQVKFSEDNDQYFFEVKDNGVGMEQKFHDKAFQPFQRLNNQERPGTGMGLAICKKIAILHGGDIRFESEKGIGTTFYFSISKKIHSCSKNRILLAEASN